MIGRTFLARTLLASALLALGLAALRPAPVRAIDDPAVESVTVPATVSAHGSYTCTVTLDQTAPSDTVVSLNSWGDGEFTTPSHVVVLEGQTSANFDLETGDAPGYSGGSITVQAVAGNGVGQVGSDQAQALWAD